jgi:hypothetical protein
MKISQINNMTTQQATIYNYIVSNTSICLNPQKKTCFLCKKKIYKATKPRGISRHHISYYPEITCWIHEDCHKRIHDPDNPLKTFIMYTRNDSIKFYKVNVKND